VTGAGFGGATVHLARPGQGEALLARLQAGFEARFGYRPEGWLATPVDGALASA
jgi:galactokinase